MNGPALDGWRFLWACGIGLILGLYYGFLRPLRPKHTLTADTLFLPAMFFGWLYLGFAICQGDLRLGYCLGLLLGGFFWEMTVGKLLRPVFRGFGRIISKIFRSIWNIIRKIFEKTHKISKKIFALWKKSFTIEGTTRMIMRKKNGGVPHDKKEEHL